MANVNKDLFRSLLAYKSIMAQAKVLLRRGVITRKEYVHFDTMFTKKYDVNAMSAATRQAVLLLASHFYESRDGSTGGFFTDRPDAGTQVWNTVHALLDMGKDWVV